MSFRKPTLSALALAALLAAPLANAAKETKYIPKTSSYEKLPAAKKGGTLYMPLSNNPKVLNPLLSNDQNSTYFDTLLFTTLFTEDADTLQPLPLLAESYSISADRKSYTFVLNKDAKWQDGTPVTTDDVKFTFDTMMNPSTDAAPMRAYWQDVKLEVKDPKTFVFSVSEPKFDTLRSLYLFPTIQKKQFANEKNFNLSKGILNPVGSGPYKLKSFSRDQRVELERNKEWWGSKLPHMKNRFNADMIVYRVITDPNLEYERWLKGDIDIIDFQSPLYETYVRKAKGTDKDKVGTSPKSGKNVWTTEIANKAPRGYSYVGWNLRLPMFASKKTRQALAHLADVKEITDKVYYGFAYQSTSPFGSLTMNSDPDLRKPGKMLSYDPKKALQLLKEDGWSDSDGDNVIDKTINGKKVPFKFVLKYNSNNPTRGKIAQILQQNFRKAGIQIEIRSMEWNAYLEDIDNRRFDAIVMGWTATPYPNPRQTWHTESEKNKGSNFGAYSNPKVDELITKANVEFDPAKRSKMMQEINRILYDDQPYMWLTEPKALILGANKKVNSSVWAMTYDVYPAFDLYTFAE